MKKSLYRNSIVLAVMLMSAVGCTRNVSSNLTDNGHVNASDLVFPATDEAWQQEGKFVNEDNLAKIRAGVNKDELYQLIGPPHFSEGYKAREWDYIFKFYDENDQVKICQYKVIFDKEYRGQEFYWLPADCAPNTAASMPYAPVAVTPPMTERINLGADALFAFDKSSAQDIIPDGRYELDALAQKLREYQQMGSSRVLITGHTDRKGDEAYNMRLSTQRAHTVANYLVSQGVNPNTISAVGAGEMQPVQQCSTSLPRQQEIACLQPNRRVTIDVTFMQ
ncbi:OmpA family protein [Psychrobacter sp. 1U2]|uniref:OmpA family protein n=1 Tax=Psychrobacter sp. 1U2 TaxID=3453577 RepID=UPI003F472E79